MPFFTPTPERISDLIDRYSDGACDEAQITGKNDDHYYTTELEEIGPMYIMDDFGEAIKVTFALWRQCCYIYPPLAELT